MKRVVTCIAGALLAGCRGEAVTPTESAMQFYTMREAVGGTGAPSARELAALRPFITDALAQALSAADSMRAADRQHAPSEKPRFADGDLFSSLFEAPSSFRVMPALAGQDTVLVPVDCTYDRERPAVRWTDTAVVVRSAGGWRVQDIRYGGSWDLANRGTLLRTLSGRTAR